MNLSTEDLRKLLEGTLDKVWYHHLKGFTIQEWEPIRDRAITSQLSAFESVETERQQEKLRTWRVLPLDDNMSAVLCKNCGVNQMPPPTYVNQDGSFNCVNCGEKLYPFGKREWEYRKTAKEILFLYGKTLKDCNKMFNKNQILIPEHIFITAMEQTTTLPPANQLTGMRYDDTF